MEEDLRTRTLRPAGFGKTSLSLWQGSACGEKCESVVTQLCLALCGPIDCSPPGSSVHGILQARKLEWVAVPFSRGSSLLRD